MDRGLGGRAARCVAERRRRSAGAAGPGAAAQSEAGPSAGVERPGQARPAAARCGPRRGPRAGAPGARAAGRRSRRPLGRPGLRGDRHGPGAFRRRRPGPRAVSALHPPAGARRRDGGRLRGGAQPRHLASAAPRGPGPARRGRAAGARRRRVLHRPHGPQHHRGAACALSPRAVRGRRAGRHALGRRPRPSGEVRRGPGRPRRPDLPGRGRRTAPGGRPCTGPGTRRRP